MRLRSDIWIKAYIRRCAGEGVSVMVVRHGDDQAGAIFIRVCLLDGTSHLYGPAPAGLDASDGERRWMALLGAASTADRDVDSYLIREAEYDPDLWIIEVEDRQGRHFLEGWLGT